MSSIVVATYARTRYNVDRCNFKRSCNNATPKPAFYVYDFQVQKISLKLKPNFLAHDMPWHTYLLPGGACSSA